MKKISPSRRPRRKALNPLQAAPKCALRSARARARVPVIAGHITKCYRFRYIYRFLQ